MGDWFDAAQAQYDAEVPAYLEDGDDEEFDDEEEED